MGMAIPERQSRAPYRLGNGLMHCEACPCTYSRGNWCMAWHLNSGTTEAPRYQRAGDIPDDVCPCCRTKEESNESKGGQS